MYNDTNLITNIYKYYKFQKINFSERFLNGKVTILHRHFPLWKNHKSKKMRKLLSTELQTLNLLVVELSVKPEVSGQSRTAPTKQKSLHMCRLFFV